jgi:antitoxin ParD1/3/4
MDLSLQPELQRFVDEQVKAGRFESAEQVVRTAVASFRAGQEAGGPMAPEELDALRAEIAVGIAQADRGELEPWDGEEVWAEVERRHAAERKGRG